MKRKASGRSKQSHYRADQDGNTDDEGKKPLLVNQKDKYRSMRQRVATGTVLSIFFASMIYLGHVALTLMILAIQAWMVRELFALARKGQEAAERRIKGFRGQQWFFFAIVVFFVYGRFVRNNLFVEVALFRSARLQRLTGWLLSRHTFISFTLYIVGFVRFVLSLEKGMYMYQFGQYAWTHMICFLVVLPSSFFVSNIFECGILWFVLPAVLIIINDVMAYFFGFYLGSTPLIKLSPKKTWEGFLGAIVSTVLISFYFARFLSRFQWMICPRTDLSVRGWLSCGVSELYTARDYGVRDLADLLPEETLELVRPLARLQPEAWRWLDSLRLHAQPMQLHAMSLATFASLIGPFGGFFASGFKRAFGVKDFGDAFPGHGGMTDRMDCQVLMAVFSYLYYHNFVLDPQADLSVLMDLVLQLPTEDQTALMVGIGRVLEGKGVLGAAIERLRGRS